MPDRAIDQFSPELMQLLTAASHKTIVVQVPSQAKAVSLRYRLYHLRKRLQKEGAPHQRHLLRTQFIIHLDGVPFNYSRGSDDRERITSRSKWEVVCSPTDADVQGFILKALNEQAPEIIAEKGEMGAPDLSGMIDTLPPDGEPEPEDEEAEVKNKS